MEVSDEQQKNLNSLISLLNFGHLKLTEIQFIPNKKTLKKRALFMTMIASQSYSESILKIITPTTLHTSIYINAAFILYRSITENLINTKYILACKNQENAALFYYNFLNTKIKYANKYKNLILKYPTWNLAFGSIKNIQDWDKHTQKLTKKQTKLAKYHKIPSLKKLPTLEQRCQIHDKFLANMGNLNESNSLEKLYVTYYSYFSGVAHITSDGFDEFISNVNGEQIISIDSDPEGLKSIIQITYANYLETLSLFLNKFNIYRSSEFRCYIEYLKDMHKT